MVPILAFSSGERTLRSWPALGCGAARAPVTKQANFEDQVRDTTQILARAGPREIG
jgi:hypothetical protein